MCVWPKPTVAAVPFIAVQVSSGKGVYNRRVVGKYIGGTNRNTKAPIYKIWRNKEREGLIKWGQQCALARIDSTG